MQRAEIDRDQQQFKQQIKELKAAIAGLTARREKLAQDNRRASLLMQKLGQYFGLGAGGKLKWVSWKLAHKQKQLAALVMHPEERMNGVATLLRMIPQPTAPNESKPQKPENPLESESSIRRIYQPLIEAKQ